MTLKEYVDGGHMTVEAIATSLGRSEWGVRKWMYGQREPDISTAIKIEALTKGKVTIAELSREVAGARPEGEAA